MVEIIVYLDNGKTVNLKVKQTDFEDIVEQINEQIGYDWNDYKIV